MQRLLPNRSAKIQEGDNMNANVLCEFKKILLNTMYNFDEFCVQNNLQYFACSGTAIGAVRHKGFIPWDDDIDIFMPRKDYNKLVAMRHELKARGYAIKNLGDDEYIYAFAKFYDINTTLIETDSFPNCLLGVYLDIFPLDEVDGTLDEIKNKKEVYTSAYRKFQDTFLSLSMRQFISCLYHKDFTRLKELLMLLVQTKNKKKEIRTKFKQIEDNWAEERGIKLMTHSGIYALDKELFDKSWFSESIRVPFENIQINIPKEYDKYLSHLYGDYMVLPPLEKRVSMHPHFYLNLKEGLTLKDVERRIQKGEHLVY